MKRIESDIKHISFSQETVYAKVSDLSNLQSLVDLIPEDQKASANIESLTCTPDTVSCNISPIGQIEFGVVSREPFKCVKLETTNSPVKVTMWIQLVSTGSSSCKIKLTADIDLNAFMVKMVEKPITEALNKLADTLAMIPY
ncbi:MAG: SRPBCC family protein [Bacteroidaceae bacterium]|nr:SRPBCC family protein [Bacteroidaceae bacterium]